MATWQERMADRVSDERTRPVMERLAEGLCVDEGERATDWDGLHPVLNRLAEDREAIIETDLDAAEWLGANPPDSISEPYRGALIQLAASPSPQVRRALFDAMTYQINIPGVVRTRPAVPPYRRGSKDPLTTKEFMARYHEDVAAMVRYEGLTRKEAQNQFPWRYAEARTGIARCPQKSKNKAQRTLEIVKKAAYMRLYNNI